MIDVIWNGIFEFCAIQEVFLERWDA